jgi:hypothetical protein
LTWGGGRDSRDGAGDEAPLQVGRVDVKVCDTEWIETELRLGGEKTKLTRGRCIVAEPNSMDGFYSLLCVLG